MPEVQPDPSGVEPEAQAPDWPKPNVDGLSNVDLMSVNARCLFEAMRGAGIATSAQVNDACDLLARWNNE
jgi:hypothetical protein